MPFPECPRRRRGKGCSFHLSPHASSVFLLCFSSSPLRVSPLWRRIFLLRVLFCKRFRLAGHLHSCEAQEHKQPYFVSQHLRIGRLHPAASSRIPAPAFPTRGAPRAPSIISRRPVPRSFSPAHCRCTGRLSRDTGSSLRKLSSPPSLVQPEDLFPSQLQHRNRVK